MRLVYVNQEQQLELRWTWLPYWIVASPAFKADIERRLQDAVLLNGIVPTPDNLDLIENFVQRQICKKFGIPGLEKYLEGLRYIEVLTPE